VAVQRHQFKFKGRELCINIASNNCYKERCCRNNRVCVGQSASTSKPQTIARVESINETKYVTARQKSKPKVETTQSTITYFRRIKKL